VSNGSRATGASGNAAGAAQRAGPCGVAPQSAPFGVARRSRGAATFRSSRLARHALRHDRVHNLFLDEPSELSEDGASLRERVLVLDAVRRELADWLAEPVARTTVRLSAGTWTCSYLVERFAELHQANDNFSLQFISTEHQLGIAHREIDIGLRNARPEENNLVARRTSEVCFASYASAELCARNSNADQLPWLLVVPECARTRSTRWMVEHRIANARVQASSTRTLLDLALAGAGATVLPCFVGDRLPTLRRVGPIIDELTESQWLVLHSETRNRPAVRTVIDRLSALFETCGDLYRGERETTAD